MSEERRCLSGGKMGPLSVAAIRTLTELCRDPVPTSEINPGICDRLTREDLARVEVLPSPFKSHKGRRICHLVVTEAGRDRIRSLEKPL